MASNPTPLPPPASGQFLEISFRRLLKTCWEIVGGDNKGKKELTAWRGSPLFHHVSGAVSRHALLAVLLHPERQSFNLG